MQVLQFYLSVDTNACTCMIECVMGTTGGNFVYSTLRMRGIQFLYCSSTQLHQLISGSPRRLAMLRCYSVLPIALLLVVVGGRGLHLLTPRDVGGAQGSDGAALLRTDRQTGSTQPDCPNYMVGVGPKSEGRVVDGCEVGKKAGQVDHELAFGFPTSRVDWRACNLPKYPAEK